jgi:hypothetical protein
MSDALTDIARDNERAEKENVMLDSIIAYLENTAAKSNLKKVLDAAESTDGVRGGYWGRGTNFRKNMEERLAGLVARDEESWAKFLAPLLEDWIHFKKLKVLSPFADYMLALVDYGRGSVNTTVEGGGAISGDLVDRLVREKGWYTRDCDDYFIALPEDKRGKPKVFWLRCGYYDITEPRVIKMA